MINNKSLCLFQSIQKIKRLGWNSRETLHPQTAAERGRPEGRTWYNDCHYYARDDEKLY